MKIHLISHQLLFNVIKQKSQRHHQDDDNLICTNKDWRHKDFNSFIKCHQQ